MTGLLSMRAILLSLLLCSPFATECFSQELWKVEALKQPPPAAVAPEIRSILGDQGFRILDEQGKTYAEIWLRRAIPSSEKPGGPKGAVQFPFLKEGELLGSLQFANEGHDYRDQSITKGVYTMRYGLQPVNGDHLGVSTYRDYSLLLPASKDKSLVAPPRKQLEERSAESAGTSHPAVFIMLMAPAGASKTAASIIRDAEKDTWSVVLPLALEVKGQSESVVHPVRIVVDGAAQP
jgi:hypothetical protein